jgi:3-hydroxyisobutyrate dehydrogenase
VIGVGTMGLPMGRRLVDAGFEVTACDVDRERAGRLTRDIAPTPAEAASRAEVVLTSLPSPQVVGAVVLGPDGVLAGAEPGTLLLEMSTGPPDLARRIATESAGRLDVLDAPVSGGPRGAEDGTLTIMVGGSAETLERARPVLEHLGSAIVHTGGHGSGQAAKLCNNLVAGATMAALAEVCAIAEREGLDPHTLYDLLRTSTGDSRVLRTRFPLAGVDGAHPASQGFAPLFAVDLIAKDLALAIALAGEHGIATPVAGAAHAAYREAQEAGHGGRDYSAVFLVRGGSGEPIEANDRGE